MKLEKYTMPFKSGFQRKVIFIKRENLEKAEKINKEIIRLEQEIEFLDDPNTEHHWITKALRPKKYTYKGYFCSERDIDCIGSSIYLDHSECVVLADYKRQEIKKLEEQYRLLDMEGK